MKKSILIISLFLIVNLSSAQTILDLFRWLPDTIIPYIDQLSRDYMIAVQTNDESIDFDNLKDMPYSFELVEPKTGFLRIIGNNDELIEMCCWNMSGNAKVVAFYYQKCSKICSIDRFNFLRFDGSYYEPLFFNDIIPEDIEKDFFKGDMMLSLSEMKSKGYSATLLYKLAQKGKNIIVKFGNEESNDIYEKWLKGNRMELIWKSGKFEKGKIYWE